MRVSRVVSDMKKHRPCLRADIISSVSPGRVMYIRESLGLRVIFYSRLTNDNSLGPMILNGITLRVKSTLLATYFTSNSYFSCGFHVGQRNLGI